jgi:hypothetical protein
VITPPARVVSAQEWIASFPCVLSVTKVMMILTPILPMMNGTPPLLSYGEQP